MGSRRWNWEFSIGAGSSSYETRGSGNGPGCLVVENRDSSREIENPDSGIGGSDGGSGGLRGSVESGPLTVNGIS